MICSSCSNEFLQPFVCTTCGAQKLRDETVKMLENENAALRKQREWKGLTDEEISAVDWKSNETLHDFARSIEAKLKEKNGGDAASDTELRRLGYTL